MYRGGDFLPNGVANLIGMVKDLDPDQLEFQGRIIARDRELQYGRIAFSGQYSVTFRLSSGSGMDTGDLRNSRLIYDFYVRPKEQVRTVKDAIEQSFYKGFVYLHFDGKGKLVSWEVPDIRPDRKEQFPWLENFLMEELRARKGLSFKRTQEDPFPQGLTTLPFGLDPEARSVDDRYRSEIRENENAEMDAWKHHWRGFGERSEEGVLVAGPAGFFVSRSAQKAQGTILQRLSAPLLVPAVDIRVPLAEIPNAKLAGFDILAGSNKRSEVRRDIRALMEERVKGLDSTYPKMLKIWEIVAEISQLKSSFEKINTAKDVVALVIAFKEAKAVLEKTLEEQRSSVLLRVFDFTKSELWVYPLISAFFAAFAIFSPGEMKWFIGLIFIGVTLWGTVPPYRRWFLKDNEFLKTHGKRVPLSEEVDLYGKLLLDALDRIMIPIVIQEEHTVFDSQKKDTVRSEIRDKERMDVVRDQQREAAKVLVANNKFKRVALLLGDAKNLLKLALNAPEGSENADPRKKQRFQAIYDGLLDAVGAPDRTDFRTSAEFLQEVSERDPEILSDVFVRVAELSRARFQAGGRSESRISAKAGEEEVRARLQTLEGSENPQVHKRAKQFLSQSLISGGRKGSANLVRAKEFINEVADSQAARSEVRSQEERYAAALEILRQYGQEHVLKFWNELDVTQREQLLGQIESAPLSEVARLKESLIDHPQPKQIDLSSAVPVELAAANDPADQKAGEELLSWGAEEDKAAFGIVLMAGGSGARFREYFPFAKGLFKGLPLSDDTIFESMVKKYKAFANRYGHKKIFPLIVVTSDVTHDETIAYFESQNWFGMKDRIKVVKQIVYPLIDQKTGKIFMEEKGKMALQGGGHGDAFDYILQVPEVKQWLGDFGVRTVLYSNIDNPLYPLDANWTGAHARFVEKVKKGLTQLPKGFAIMSEGLIRKKDRLKDKLSELLKVNGIRMPVHYSKASPELRAQTSHGTPSFRMIELPLDGTLPIDFSVADKKWDGIDENGNPVKQVKVWKFERNSDDKMSDGANFPFENEDTFASIKEPPGKEESPDTSRALQTKHWRVRLEAAGYHVDDGFLIQLPWAADFMSPLELRQKLETKKFPNDLTPVWHEQPVRGYLVNDDWSWGVIPQTAVTRSEVRGKVSFGPHHAREALTVMKNGAKRNEVLSGFVRYFQESSEDAANFLARSIADDLGSTEKFLAEVLGFLRGPIQAETKRKNVPEDQGLRVFLASASPRRLKIVQKMFPWLQPEMVEADYGAEPEVEQGDPASKVAATATLKILKAFAEKGSVSGNDPQIWIAGDTLLFPREEDGKLGEKIGKPSQDAEHEEKGVLREKLRATRDKVQGRTLEAISATAYARIVGGEIKIQLITDSATIRLKKDTEFLDEYREYLLSLGVTLPADTRAGTFWDFYHDTGLKLHGGQAGGFGVQEPELAPLIDEIVGDPYVIMGFPAHLMVSVLQAEPLTAKVQPPSTNDQWPWSVQKDKMVSANDRRLDQYRETFRNVRDGAQEKKRQQLRQEIVKEFSRSFRRRPQAAALALREIRNREAREDGMLPSFYVHVMAHYLAEDQKEAEQVFQWMVLLERAARMKDSSKTQNDLVEWGKNLDKKKIITVTSSKSRLTALKTLVNTSETGASIQGNNKSRPEHFAYFEHASRSSELNMEYPTKSLMMVLTFEKMWEHLTEPRFLRKDQARFAIAAETRMFLSDSGEGSSLLEPPQDLKAAEKMAERIEGQEVEAASVSAVADRQTGEIRFGFGMGLLQIEGDGEGLSPEARDLFQKELADETTKPKDAKREDTLRDIRSRLHKRTTAGAQAVKVGDVRTFLLKDGVKKAAGMVLQDPLYLTTVRYWVGDQLSAIAFPWQDTVDILREIGFFEKLPKDPQVQQDLYKKVSQQVFKGLPFVMETEYVPPRQLEDIKKKHDVFSGDRKKIRGERDLLPEVPSKTAVRLEALEQDPRFQDIRLLI